MTDERVDDLASALSDDGDIDVAKSLINMGKGLGYDTKTPEGLEAFMSAVNRGDVPAFDGLSMPGRPMPELPDTPTKPVDRKARKNKRKASRKARKKNR